MKTDIERLEKLVMYYKKKRDRLQRENDRLTLMLSRVPKSAVTVKE